MDQNKNQNNDNQNQNLASFFQSRAFKGILAGIGGIVIFLLIFGLGVSVGFRKANFSFRWGENYHRNFGGPQGGFLADFKGQDLVNGYGVAGLIIKIELGENQERGNAIVKGKDGAEKLIVVKEDTAIRRFAENIKTSDLKNNDFIVVVGQPNESGQIEARLIRVMPAPGEMMPRAK